MSVELIACGEDHSCAVTRNGDLYTWGDGANSSGVLGHHSDANHWVAKKVGGLLVGVRISYVSCGPWHTAIISSAGQLFTFGDGSFGVLGHGDCSNTNIPREVDTLRGLRTIKVACGVWHTAAVVETADELFSSGNGDDRSFAKLFTWGQGDKGRLGHGDSQTRLFPVMVSCLREKSICQVACGSNLTVALTAGGQVYTMGSTAYGQLGSPKASGDVPHLVGGKLGNSFAEEIACGAYHIAVLTSKGEVHTWGKGTNGQLGHGDNKNRNTPTAVVFLKDRQVKTVACGANFTAAISVHKSVYNSACTDCRNPLNFRRKRHNCYNCGLVFCNFCSARRSVGAALAPKTVKAYRVCDDCYDKLQKERELSNAGRSSGVKLENALQKPNEVADKVLRYQVSSLSAVDSIVHCSGILRNNIGKGRDRGNRVLPVLDGDLRAAALGVIKSLGMANASTESVLSGYPSSSRMYPPVLSAETPAPNLPRSQLASVDSCRLIASLKNEITHLKAKVEELTSKSEILEAELQKKSQVSDDVEKEVKFKPFKMTKAPYAQVKGLTERRPQQYSSDEDNLDTLKSSSDLRQHARRAVAHNDQFDGSLVNLQSLPKGTESQTEMPRQLIQAQLGVFITLTPLSDGLNELKRIRFSRKHFTEREAVKWWADNGSMLIEQYRIRSAG